MQSILNEPIVIVGAARTPMGALQGDFSALSASDFGATAMQAAISRAGLSASEVQDVFMGTA